jgi:hypothetical protein
MHKPFNWKIFFIVWIAAVIWCDRHHPLFIDLQSGTLDGLNLPMPLVLLISIAQNAVMFGILTSVGTFLRQSHRAGTSDRGGALEW